MGAPAHAQVEGRAECAPAALVDLRARFAAAVSGSRAARAGAAAAAGAHQHADVHCEQQPLGGQDGGLDRLAVHGWAQAAPKRSAQRHSVQVRAIVRQLRAHLAEHRQQRCVVGLSAPQRGALGPAAAWLVRGWRRLRGAQRCEAACLRAHELQAPWQEAPVRRAAARRRQQRPRRASAASKRRRLRHVPAVCARRAHAARRSSGRARPLRAVARAGCAARRGGGCALSDE